MDNHLIKWNTGRLIQEELSKLVFFEGYKGINLELYTIYKELYNYSKDNYNNMLGYNDRHGFDKQIYSEWIEYLDKVLEFQRFLEEKEDLDKGIIATKAKEVFNNKDVGEAYVADLDKIKKLELLLEYSESIRDLFNFILPLYKPDHKMTPELEEQIKEILDNKGLSGFEVPADLNNVEENEN